MKFAVLMVSRGRPRMMAAVLSAFDHLSSGKHEIEYAIACDEDDIETQEMASRLTADLPIRGVRIGPRPLGLGQLHNNLALDCPGDVFVLTGDDEMPITPNWDVVIADAVTEAPCVLQWWKRAENNDCTHPIVPAAWHAITGRFWSGYFPFWFDDSWLAEVWTLATGLGQIKADCTFTGRTQRPRTMGMHELEFWTRFFIWSRPERLAEAQKIRRALGLKGEDPGPRVFAELEAGNTSHLARVPELEMIFEDPRSPDERYYAAKARAEAMMRNAA